ncbi:shikimate kinase [Atopobium fossor]|uniref:shikimate kinase n=1 Tax=Atopobium fossor TaxID=39487 RepID=UPI0004236F86|nr:shikimate kinase [Atopobium fossor]
MGLQQPRQPALQMPHTPFGLLGRNLTHSWSSQIHTQLGSAPYALYEIESNQLKDFITSCGWQGLNVTIPYKKDVVQLADKRSNAVQVLGAANTLTRLPDGSIFAENTDVLGFSWMLKRFCKTQLKAANATEVCAHSKVLVLGNGGASRAVCYVLNQMQAHTVVVSRSGATNYNNILPQHQDTVLIVNTTPVGMYPHDNASPLSFQTIQTLPQLKGVLDIVYNPQNTQLCQYARKLTIPAQTGLSMLVAQAWASSKLWQHKNLSEALIERIEKDLKKQISNIAFIGMPGSGKTSTGKRLARMLQRPFVDLDDVVALACGMPVATYIQRYGEDAFRQQETQALAQYSHESGLIISCGGGIVTRSENYDLLHRNSVVVMVDRPLNELSDEGRPLSQAQGIKALAKQRMNLYYGWSNHVLHTTGSSQTDAEAVMEMLNL